MSYAYLFKYIIIGDTGECRAAKFEVAWQSVPQSSEIGEIRQQTKTEAMA